MHCYFLVDVFFSKDDETKFYYSLTKAFFRDESYKDYTELSNYIWDLMREQKRSTIKWSMVKTKT